MDEKTINFTKGIGRRIKNIRIGIKETTDEFGKHFTPPASKGTISKWENERYLPNNDRLSIIADLGGISVNELLYGLPEEYATAKLNEITKKNNISDIFFNIMYGSYPSHLKTIYSGYNPKEAVFNVFLSTKKNMLSYNYIDSEDFENDFLESIGYDKTNQNKTHKEKIESYINEAMDLEISHFNSDKYKLLYDPSFKEFILQRILTQYDFDNLTDIGIKQFTKEILDKELDYLQLVGPTSEAFSDSHSIDFTLKMINNVVLKNVDNYFFKDLFNQKENLDAIEEKLKDGLSIDTYNSIYEAVENAKQKLSEIQKKGRKN